MLWNKKFGIVFKTFDPANVGVSLINYGRKLPAELETHVSELFGEDPNKEGSAVFEAWLAEFISDTPAECKWGRDVFHDKAFSSRHVVAHQKRRKMRFFYLHGRYSRRKNDPPDGAASVSNFWQQQPY
eukprot:5269759-Pleurochrysis_carterae.AAC.1